MLVPGCTDWLAEISADLQEVVAHLRHVLNNALYKSTITLQPKCQAIQYTCLKKTSTNCSEFRIMQHELSVESVDGNKKLGSYVTTCTSYLFTLGRILTGNFVFYITHHATTRLSGSNLGPI